MKTEEEIIDAESVQAKRDWLRKTGAVTFNEAWQMMAREWTIRSDRLSVWRVVVSTLLMSRDTQAPVAAPRRVGRRRAADPGRLDGPGKVRA